MVKSATKMGSLDTSRTSEKNFFSLCDNLILNKKSSPGKLKKTKKNKMARVLKEKTSNFDSNNVISDNATKAKFAKKVNRVSINESPVPNKRKVAEAEKGVEKPVKKVKPDPEDVKKEESDEKKFKLSKKKVKLFVEALQKLTEKQNEMKKDLLNEKPPMHLQITCIKIPRVPTHRERISLPHPLVTAEDDIALIVPDLKRGRHVDYEPTITKYVEKLKEHKCDFIKVIPFNQLKTEYRQHELRKRLFNLYDAFLVDGRITGHVTKLLGKKFVAKKKLLVPVRMSEKNLKKNIQDALKKTNINIHDHGDTTTVQVGNALASSTQIAENIIAVCKYLSKNFPGGFQNIRRLCIKTPLGMAVPIHVSLENPNNVKTPVVKAKRPKAYQTVEGELSTFKSDVRVKVKPDGRIDVIKVEPVKNEDLETTELQSTLTLEDKEKTMLDDRKDPKMPKRRKSNVLESLPILKSPTVQEEKTKKTAQQHKVKTEQIKANSPKKSNVLAEEKSIQLPTMIADNLDMPKNDNKTPKANKRKSVVPNGDKLKDVESPVSKTSAKTPKGNNKRKSNVLESIPIIQEEEPTKTVQQHKVENEQIEAESPKKSNVHAVEKLVQSTTTIVSNLEVPTDDNRTPKANEKKSVVAIGDKLKKDESPISKTGFKTPKANQRKSVFAMEDKLQKDESPVSKTGFKTPKANQRKSVFAMEDKPQKDESPISKTGAKTPKANNRKSVVAFEDKLEEDGLPVSKHGAKTPKVDKRKSVAAIEEKSETDVPMPKLAAQTPKANKRKSMFTIEDKSEKEDPISKAGAQTPKANRRKSVVAIEEKSEKDAPISKAGAQPSKADKRKSIVALEDKSEKDAPILKAGAQPPKADKRKSVVAIEDKSEVNVPTLKTGAQTPKTNTRKSVVALQDKTEKDAPILKTGAQTPKANRRKSVVAFEDQSEKDELPITKTGAKTPKANKRKSMVAVEEKSEKSESPISKVVAKTPKADRRKSKIHDIKKNFSP